MAKSLFEIFNDKVSLIYEYDKSSPLFVRKANSEITKNNVDEAIGILINGIRNYPDYPTAYLILGKAYTLKGQFKDAEEAYRKGSDLIYSDSTYDFYMNEIEALKTERLIFNSDRGIAFLNGDDKEIEKDEPAVIENKNIKINDDELSTNERRNTIIDNVEEEEVKNGIKDKPNFDKEFEENLDELASEISSARMPEVDNSKIDNVSTKEFVNDDPMIVSETLAKIYEAQDENSEAIKVYKKLILKHPDKKEEYTSRIIALKSNNDKPSN